MVVPVREKLFISYSHEDQEWLDRFQTMLAPAKNILDIWSDEKIAPGSLWEQAIDRSLKGAHTALLLVSENFLNSRFITEVELPELLRASARRDLSIHWVPVAPSLYEHTALAEFQAAWKPDRPLTSLSAGEQRTAIQQICSDITSTIGQFSRVTVGERELMRDEVEAALGERIRIDGEVGAGQHSIVYSATEGERKLAVKVFVDSPLTIHSPGDLEDTVQLTSALTHPCFIRTRECQLQHKPRYVAMEFVDAPTLARVLNRRGRLGVDEVINIIGQLAQALSQAHERGLVHGMLCSSNIFYDNDGTVRVSASGFWNLLMKTEDLAGNIQTNKDALSYMVPEEYSGEALTAESDQYSLGLLALELLNGTRPVVVRCAADFELKRTFFDDPSPCIDWLKDTHRPLYEIIIGMLRRESAARWPSLADVFTQVQTLESAAIVAAKQSYRRHCEENREFYTAFYTRLMANRHELKPLFRGMNLERQCDALDAAVAQLLNFRADTVAEPNPMTHTARRHKSYCLNESDFDAFMSEFLDTLRDHSGEREDVIDAWRDVIGPGIEYMKQACRGSERHQAA